VGTVTIGSGSGSVGTSGRADGGSGLDVDDDLGDDVPVGGDAGARGSAGGTAGPRGVPVGFELSACTQSRLSSIRCDRRRAGPAEGCGPLLTGPVTAGSRGKRTTDAPRPLSGSRAEGEAGPRLNRTTAP
jgi:hypothetical protein